MRGVALLCLLCCANALFFELFPGRERCFLEDLAFDELVVGVYESEQVVSGGVGFKVTATSPSEQLINVHADKKGRFAFHSKEAGQHRLCFAANDAAVAAGTTLKVHFEVHFGSTAVNYEDIAKKQHLTDLQLDIRRLQDEANWVASKQVYLKMREMAFRDTSESTNSRAAFFSILHSIVVVFMGWLQLRHLKSFFAAKKLV